MTEEIKDEVLHVFTTEVFTTEEEVGNLLKQLQVLGLADNSIVLPAGINHHTAPRYFKDEKPQTKPVW